MMRKVRPVRSTQWMPSMLCWALAVMLGLPVIPVALHTACIAKELAASWVSVFDSTLAASLNRARGRTWKVACGMACPPPSLCSVI